MKHIVDARRIVIKIGTNSVMREDGQPAIARLYALVESLATLRRAGREVVLVSSGAVGLGKTRLEFQSIQDSLAHKQACAAVGQGRLMAFYADAFERLGVACAQVLLTEDDLASPRRCHNICATLDTLLATGVIPILNENDAIATVWDGRDRLFSDNDHLSAIIASRIGAQLLILLSDVDGVYTANPAYSVDATLVRRISAWTPDILAAADGCGSRGRGGMIVKLGAAKLAGAAGVTTIIANGQVTGIVDRICAGEAVGTICDAEMSV